MISFTWGFAEVSCQLAWQLFAFSSLFSLVKLGLFLFWFPLHYTVRLFSSLSLFFFDFSSITTAESHPVPFRYSCTTLILSRWQCHSDGDDLLRSSILDSGRTVDADKWDRRSMPKSSLTAKPPGSAMASLCRSVVINDDIALSIYLVYYSLRIPSPYSRFFVSRLKLTRALRCAWHWSGTSVIYELLCPAFLWARDALLSLLPFMCSPSPALISS